MNSDDEDAIVSPEKLPIYRKGKEIFDLIKRITDLIPVNKKHYLYFFINQKQFNC
jgi:hypothetical protein